MRPHTYWLSGLTFLLLSSFSSHALSASDALTTSKLKQVCIEEPIFNNTGCLYHNSLLTHRQTVLFIHGINGNALGDWQAQIEPLIDNYNLILLDLPGFGASSTEGAAYTPDNYVRYVKHIKEHFSLPSLVLVGHSLGSAIALQYAALYPQDVTRVLAADVAGILHKIAYTKSVTGNWLSRFFGDSLGRFFGGMTGEWMGRVEGSRYPGTEPKAGAGYPPGTIASYALILNNISPYIPLINAPVLLIWEQNDKIAPLRTGQALAAQLDNGYLDIIPGDGHSPMRDSPELFNNKMIAFIEATKDELVVMSQQQNSFLREHKDNWEGYCENKRNMEFEGDFELLSLHQCASIRIVNSTIRELSVYESRVEIINSRIGTLRSTGSEIVITASQLEGDLPLTVSRSRVDMAGVQIIGKSSSITTLIPSELIFSISEIDSPIFKGPMHGLVQLETGEQL
ncbi:alpha/beta fold hydrolase [Pseudomonadota bacterium]